MTEIEDRLRVEISKLEADFQRGEHFRVVLLAPQLLVQIVDLLGNYTDEYLRRKGYLDRSPDDDRVEDLIRRLRRAESDRAQIADAFADLYRSDRDRHSRARVEFERSFARLEALVSMRNKLAHEYYSSPPNKKNLMACAAGGLELLRVLASDLQDA